MEIPGSYEKGQSMKISKASSAAEAAGVQIDVPIAPHADNVSEGGNDGGHEKPTLDL